MTLTSSLGELTAVERDGAIVGLYFPGHWHRPDRTSWGEAATTGFGDLGRQLATYLSGDRRVFDLPTRTSGTRREERVWALLREIPYGDTTTYGDLARELDDGTTAREVGGIVGRNPISIVIPCHRVVGADGKLTGYAGGLDRKRALLDLEADVAGRAGRLF